MLTVYTSSDTGLFKHLSNHALHILQSIIFETNQLWGSYFFSKCSKFDVDFRNGKKNWKKFLDFWENWIWIDFAKQSLLPRENACHRESIGQQRVKRFQILLRQNFLNRRSSWLIKKYDDTTAVKISAMFRTA